MAFARAMIAALTALTLCAATEPPPPPPELAAYVKDGRLKPGDYAWLRGVFPDATPEQKAVFEAVVRWGAECRKSAHEQALKELAELGIEAPTLTEGYSDCPGVMPRIDTQRPFAELEAAMREAKPIADTYIAAARLAEERALGNAESFGEALTARTIEEQMLRMAMSWGREPLSDVPELSPDGQEAMRQLIWDAATRSDVENTAWLKSQVEEKGWPKVSDVGEKGSNAAWLLTQHADLDPVFQLRALRLMEPLVTQGEVSKSNFAYLYDRIMLKLTDKQRYGTQWGACEGDVRPLRPLEDEARLAELRAEMGLQTIEEYARGMDEMVGACGDD